MSSIIGRTDIKTSKTT